MALIAGYVVEEEVGLSWLSGNRVVCNIFIRILGL